MLETEKNYKVTVIIPVYKVEKFIERCTLSLLNQDLEDVEYIFINDASPDNSLRILEKIVENCNRKKDIIISSNEKNIGVAKTRKKGMLMAKGEYVIQIDADDWVEDDMLSSLYKKAKEEQSDVAICNYFVSHLKKEYYIEEEYKKNINYNIKNMLLGYIHPSFWRTLIRRNYYIENNLIPSGDFNMGEDIEIMLRLFSLTSKVSYVPKGLYHYIQYNSSSLTKSLDERAVNDAIIFIPKVVDFITNLKEDYTEELRSMMVFYKKVFILDKRHTHLFYKIYPEANKFKYIFMYNFGIAQKITMCFMLLKMPFVSRLLIKTHIWIRKKFKSIKN